MMMACYVAAKSAMVPIRPATKTIQIIINAMTTLFLTTFFGFISLGSDLSILGSLMFEFPVHLLLLCRLKISYKFCLCLALQIKNTFVTIKSYSFSSTNQMQSPLNAPLFKNAFKLANSFGYLSKLVILS